MTDLFAGIETGGTTVVAGVAVLEHGRPLPVGPAIVVPTGDPIRVFEEVASNIVDAVSPGVVRATGIASFGPVDLAEGRMLGTPKPGWAGFALVDEWVRRVAAPVGLDTDVNAAALAEHRWGAARGAGVAAYVTVGTGIGVGIVVDGAPLHGLLHPEMGHLPVPRRVGDDFAGACGVHGDCLEGMAAGPSIRGRVGESGESLPDDHPIWETVAWYLGVGMSLITLAVSPEVIVLGGGVMKRPLLGEVERIMNDRLGGYVPAPRIVPPALERPGLMGAFALAAEAARR